MLKTIMKTVRFGFAATASCAMLMLASPAAWAAPTHYCAAAATGQAGKLLAFHAGTDSRLEIGKSVTTLSPIRNPANTKQLFDVLEVRGNIYKAEYRMRFIYARIPNTCVLMGQEILESSNL